MSDETPPPSLRLKPRQRPEEEAPATPPAAAPEQDVGKLRLKPKLPGEGAAEAAPAQTPAPVPAPAEPVPDAPVAAAGEKIRLKPKLNQEPATPAGAAPAAGTPPAPAAPPPEAVKVKLKIKVPGAAIEAAAAAPQEVLPEDAPPDLIAPPPFPVVAETDPKTGKSAPPPVAPKPGAPRPGAPVRRLPAATIAASARRRRIVKLILIGFGALGLAAAIMSLAIYKFIDPPPPPPSRIPKPRPVETPPPEVATPAPEVVKTPETEQVAVPKPLPPKTRPKSGVTTTAATQDLAPGVTVTTEAVQAEIEASPAFRTFVADAKISGVFQGTPSRAFINGRLVRSGEVVDSGLGIKFESVDPKTKSIVFKDNKGAIVSRRY